MASAKEKGVVATKISSAVSSVISRARESTEVSDGSNINPPPTVPGRLPSTLSLDGDTRAFYSALSEVRLTESAIEKEMQPGGCLEHYELEPDDAHSVNCDIWLGGLHERTVICRDIPLTGMAFATLHRRATCARGVCLLDVAPCCGLCRCFLYRRYKLAIRKDGSVEIINNFPVRPLSLGCSNGANWISGCCMVCTALTCGEFESKKKYHGTLCVTQTKDGARILRLEEGIMNQREVIQAAAVGARRRGVPDAEVAQAIQEEKPFFLNWTRKYPKSKEPPIAVAVPMER